ncbi:MAG: ATP-binding protein [Deltaproteobacteria bacterium]|nr:ATP-binding protein [Deltaproteobacteria bacterium]
MLGPRRVGKTTFLKTNYSDYLYISLDDFDYLILAQEDPKAVVHGKKKLIIDEIQRVPKLTIAVKHAIDEFNSNVIMTGSSSIGLLDSSADTLAGRIKFYHLPPACWGEDAGEPTHNIFLERASPLQIKSAQRELSNFLKFGGFPEVLTLPTSEEKSEKLKDYKNTYFTRDLSLLSNIESVSGLLAILNHYALSIGSLTHVSTFRNESGLSHQTAQKYLNVIYQSDLGFKLLGYQYGPAKRYIKAGKSYFCDTSMIHALGVECSQGQILENFVISELEKRRKLGFIKSEQFYYYQSIGGSEVDLVFQEKKNIFAIEIKATKNPQSKDMRNLKDFIKDSDKGHIKGFLFYLGTDYLEIDGISVLPVASLFRGI